MKAILVESRGGTEVLKSKDVPDPGAPKGHDLLIRVKAASINPIDVKVRAGRYDDYPDYYDRVPKPHQILGYDGSGTVEAVGPSVKNFSPGDAVFYSGSPIRHGSNASLQLVDSRSCALKPSSLSFVEAAAMPLTYITAYEALVERLEIPKVANEAEAEQAGLLIINGAGGVGAVATQIARKLCKLPVVVTTASRPETVEFSKKMGATHVVNHREDVVKQVAELKLDVPIKYIFITHSTDTYLDTCAKICAPFGKVCSIVQGKASMYGTEFMAKSLSFVWALLGTKPYYQVDMESHGRILDELRGLVEEGKVVCHLTQRLSLTLEGVKKAHEINEKGGSIGKVGLSVDEVGDAVPFA